MKICSGFPSSTKAIKTKVVTEIYRYLLGFAFQAAREFTKRYYWHAKKLFFIEIAQFLTNYSPYLKDKEDVLVMGLFTLN